MVPDGAGWLAATCNLIQQPQILGLVDQVARQEGLLS